MLAMCYQEALQENGCLELLELQSASQHMSWKAASTDEVTFACYLANKLDIRVGWDPFHQAPELDSTMTILAGHRQHSNLLDGQTQNPGLP